MKHLVLASMFGSLLACQATDSAPEATRTVAAPTKVAESVPAEPTKVEPTKVEPAKVEPTPIEPTKVEPTPIEPTPAEPTPANTQPEAAPAEPAGGEPSELAKADPSAAEPAAAPAAPDVPIQPLTAQPLTAAWRLVAEPAEAVNLVDLNAGVLARSGTKWFQRGDADTLAPLEMDREPKLPVLGTWPSDAWFVDSREVEADGDEGEGGEGYTELRLMKLRMGKRWTPQVYGPMGEQWFHPGTEHWHQTHISALSGLLVYTDEFDSITRVAGKHPDPVIGPHRGTVAGFLETGTAEIYVITWSDDQTLVQVDCADEACVARSVMRLPLNKWVFGRAVARGRHAVSMLVTGCEHPTSNGTLCQPTSAREFILHNHGKAGSWVLEEMPASERATGLWASAAGGLWTLAGERLRWRDTRGTWHDVALPEGMVGPSVALTEDRTQVWVAGQVGGAAKVFATGANAPAPAP